MDVAPPSQEDLPKQEQRELERLKQQDQEIRRHEQGHVAAGGQYVRRGARFSYTTGPDGRLYATGGDVRIDATPESSPRATIRKMRAIQRAAMAPAQPSPQDHAVRAAAEKQEKIALQRVNQERAEQAQEGPQASQNTMTMRTGRFTKGDFTMVSEGADATSYGRLIQGVYSAMQNLGAPTDQPSSGSPGLLLPQTDAETAHPAGNRLDLLA